MKPAEIVPVQPREEQRSRLRGQSSYRRARSSRATLEDATRLAAHSDVPVMVTAESRQHRDMYARLIHTSGPRARGPFVTFTVNRAADTDAGSTFLSRPEDEACLRRKFEHARGGTLYVEDIATLTADLQAQFLTLLDEGALLSSSSTPGVRIVAGAGRHLDHERAAGSFDEPLFYRLNLIHLDLIDLARPAPTPLPSEPRSVGNPQQHRKDDDRDRDDVLEPFVPFEHRDADADDAAE